MHQKYLFLPLSLLLGFGCAPQAPTVTGRAIVPAAAPSFTASAHGFAVWFPTKPRQSQGTSPTITLFKTQVDAVNYGVVVSRLKPGDDPSHPKENLDGIQWGMLKSSAGKLQKIEDIHLGGFQGRAIQHTLLNGAAIIRARIYVTPKGSFCIAAGGYNARMQRNDAQITKFLDSFRILPQ